MREFVRIGAPEEIVAYRERWLSRAPQIAADLSLPHTLDVANDPFFGRVGQMMAVSQRQQALKFELLIPYHADAVPTACMSFNYHREHFGTVWNMKDERGEPAHTSCVAFGIDRLVVALFANLGLDPDRPGRRPPGGRSASEPAPERPSCRSIRASSDSSMCWRRETPPAHAIVSVARAPRPTRRAHEARRPGAADRPHRDRLAARPRGPLNARLYSPAEARAGMLPGVLVFARRRSRGGKPRHACLDRTVARALRSDAACSRSTIAWRPSTRFPRRSTTRAPPSSIMRTRAAAYGIDPARLAICGDSAGGTLAAAACQAAARAQDPPFALQVLICPILDYGRSSGSRADFAQGYLLDQATLDHDLRHCMPGGADARDARLSPLRAADLSGLPRTIIHTAEFDPLRDEGREYFERLAHTGMGLSYTCHPGMIHLFYGLGAVIPYARTAFEMHRARDPRGIGLNSRSAK